ncbi:MAG: T9SS type A sorting domain-containing protein [Bacteroidia bacterium]
MKKILLLLLPTLFHFLHLSSQTASPYYTGWDNSSEIMGWLQQRMGSTANSGWSVATTGGFSPAKCIIHYYPVGGSTVTDDWYVSPALYFPTGGMIDSIRTNFSGFGTPNPSDKVQIYLLRGSPIPSMTSSDTMLFDFRDSNYVADNTWRLKTNIAIPVVSGPAYIAFRYSTTINWLDIKFDNLKISGNSGTGISENELHVRLHLYPNPAAAGQQIIIENPLKKELLISIFDSNGKLLENKKPDGGSRFTFQQPPGIYFYNVIESNSNRIIDSGKLIVQ